jgi:hypothetical protein
VPLPFNADKGAGTHNRLNADTALS